MLGGIINLVSIICCSVLGKNLALHLFFIVLLVAVLVLLFMYFFCDKRAPCCLAPSLLCPWCYCSLLWKNLALHLFCIVLLVVNGIYFCVSRKILFTPLSVLSFLLVFFCCSYCYSVVIRKYHFSWHHYSCVFGVVVLC